MVSLPALVRVGETSAALGRPLTTRTPFSEWIMTWRCFGRRSAISVGRPMPRLTEASGWKRPITSSAISSLLQAISRSRAGQALLQDVLLEVGQVGVDLLHGGAHH